jgi:hypothetical protein
MRKSTLLKVSAGVVVMVLVCGCAAIGKGPSDEELIGRLLETWKATGEAQDIDGQMALISENFEGEQGGKDELKEFMLEAKDMGYLEDMKINLDDVEVKIDGTTATAYPMIIETAMGEATIGLELTKEAGGWMVTGMEMEY